VSLNSGSGKKNEAVASEAKTVSDFQQVNKIKFADVPGFPDVWKETLCFVDLPLQTASRLPSWRQAIWPIADEDGVVEVGSDTARADVVVAMRAVVVGRA